MRPLVMVSLVCAATSAHAYDLQSFRDYNNSCQDEPILIDAVDPNTGNLGRAITFHPEQGAFTQAELAALQVAADGWSPGNGQRLRGAEFGFNLGAARSAPTLDDGEHDIVRMPFSTAAMEEAGLSSTRAAVYGAVTAPGQLVRTVDSGVAGECHVTDMDVLVNEDNTFNTGQTPDQLTGAKSTLEGCGSGCDQAGPPACSSGVTWAV